MHDKWLAQLISSPGKNISSKLARSPRMTQSGKMGMPARGPDTAELKHKWGSGMCAFDSIRLCYELVIMFLFLRPQLLEGWSFLSFPPHIKPGMVIKASTVTSHRVPLIRYLKCSIV